MKSVIIRCCYIDLMGHVPLKSLTSVAFNACVSPTCFLVNSFDFENVISAFLPCVAVIIVAAFPL